MLKIAVCDADLAYAEASAEIWSRVFFDTEDVSFRFFTTGGELADAVGAGVFPFDVLILDPLLPDVNGIHLLQFVRQNLPGITILLQTEEGDLARIGYRWGVYDFILKHTSIREIERAAVRYLTEKVQTQADILQVSVQGSPQRLRLPGIIFFESEARKIHAFGSDEAVSFYMKMDELELRLRDRGFLRCHQSYLVNTRWIRGCTAGMLVLINKNTIPVSRRYLPAIRAFLEKKAEEEQAMR